MHWTYIFNTFFQAQLYLVSKSFWTSWLWHNIDLVAINDLSEEKRARFLNLKVGTQTLRKVIVQILYPELGLIGVITHVECQQGSVRINWTIMAENCWQWLCKGWKHLSKLLIKKTPPFTFFISYLSWKEWKMA